MSKKLTEKEQEAKDKKEQEAKELKALEAKEKAEAKKAKAKGILLGNHPHTGKPVYKK